MSGGVISIDECAARIRDMRAKLDAMTARAEAAEAALALVHAYAAYYAEVTARGDAPENFSDWRNGANDALNPYVAQQEAQP